MKHILCRTISEDEKAYILQHFKYVDGQIFRDDRKSSNGSKDKYGYLIIKIKGKQYKAHHIAWLLVYGEYPKYEIDHINKNKLDNRISNLRISNRTEQTRNTTRNPNPVTGKVGIHYDRTKGLKKNYTFKCLGKTYRFATLKEAEEKRHELQKIERR